MFGTNRLRRLKSVAALATFMTFGSLHTAPARSEPAAATANAPADTSTSGGLEEIVVTARKREESVMRTPVIVQVFTQQAIEDLRIVNYRDLAVETPGLLINDTDATTTVYFRGIGNGEGIYFSDMAVLLNVDGISLTNGAFYRSSMFDTQQIEVMKGPQALFFGRSASAGIIAIHSADPTDTWTTQGQVGYEYYAAEEDLNGFVSGPITDKLGIRIAAYHNTMEGYFKDPLPNADSPRVPDEEDDGERLTLKYDDSDVGLRAKLKVADNNSFSHSWNGDISQLTCASPPTPRNPARAGETCSPSNIVDTSGRGLPYNPNVNWPDAYGNTAAFSTGSPDPLYESGVGYTYTRTFLTSLEIDYDLTPGLTFTSVSGWTNLRTADVGLYDQPPPLGVATLYTQHSASEELRLTSDWKQSWINFTVGGLYNPDSAQNHINIDVPIATYYTQSDARVDTKVWSGFGQVLLTPIDKWELAAGARYTSVRKQLPFLVYSGDTAGFYPPNVGLVGDVVPYLPSSETRYSETNTSPEVTLTYRPDDRWTDYVALKKGYRGPGLNVDGSAAAFSPATEGFFHGETVKGAEGGIKALLLDRRLSLTADIYRYEYNNLQVAYVSAVDFNVLVENGANARTQGAEFAVAYSPANLESLTLNASFNYNESKYTYFPEAPCYAGETNAAGCVYPTGMITGGHQNNAGKILPHAPRVTGQVGGNYKVDLSANYSLSFTSNLNYSSRYEADPYYNPFGFQGGYATLDAAIHLGRRNEIWDLALIGRDLTNRYIVSSGLEEGTTKGPGQIGDVIDYVQRPRQVLLQLTVHPKL